MMCSLLVGAHVLQEMTEMFVNGSRADIQYHPPCPLEYQGHCPSSIFYRMHRVPG